MEELSEEEFKKLGNPSYDLEGESEKLKGNLNDAYLNIIDILKDYCDLRDDYYPLVSIWIIGTYFHEQFESYPYLFLNAMRGSGKTRTLKLITKLSKDGEVQASLTEAVLFRTKGTLGLDEFEGVSRKGNENLRELLNAAYKKGTKVKRMKQQKTVSGNEQVVEEFNVYRPIVMANIYGQEEVLGDRCITLILERSSNTKITQKVEIYEYDEIFKETKKLLNGCSLCSVVTPVQRYREWNNFVSSNYISTLTTNNTYNIINYIQLFKSLNLLGASGRDLELVMPMLLISFEISEKAFKDTLNSISNYIKEKKEDQFAESKDISLIDFVSQYHYLSWVRVKKLDSEFRQFLQSDEEWINTKWLGRALKRLNLIKEKRRQSGGIEVILNIEKAQDKIRMFK